MEVARSIDDLYDVPPGCVVSIGNYDGVHLGHQAIIKRVLQRAEELGAPSAALTFHPHPLKLLKPKEAPRLLMTLQQRLQVMELMGLDLAIVLPFDARLARMSAPEFTRQILAKRLKVKWVVVGKGFRFGRDREGSLELLAAMGRGLGFDAEGVAPVRVGADVVSSTRIRQLVAHGKVKEAWRMLGRPFFVDGNVFMGERFGRRLGFPTLNLAVDNEIYPAHGVYVTATYLPSFGRTFASVTNVGVRPTVYENYSTTIESHLLDFTAELYNERVRLFFLERLRDEKVFPSTLELVAQIRRDVEATKKWFASRPLDELGLLEMCT